MIRSASDPAGALEQGERLERRDSPCVGGGISTISLSEIADAQQLHPPRTHAREVALLERQVASQIASPTRPA